MSNWLLSTTFYRADGVFSELRQEDTLFCEALEHSYNQPDGTWLPKLPRGATYRCVRGMHTLERYNKGDPFETFEITGVPGHTGILFHPGNLNSHSNGCVLLGMKREVTSDNTWIITSSRDAFALFMTANTGVDSFDLEVQ